MQNNKTVSFYTLGCKLNFAETSTLARQFERAGYLKTDFENGADVLVINSCSVTEDANRDCRRIIRNVLKISPETFVIVTGCYAQLKPLEIAAMQGVDLVVGINEKFKIPFYFPKGKEIVSLKKKNKTEIHSCSVDEVLDFTPAFSSPNLRTRAFLKVQDGCNYNCSYCTIPLARGKSRSDTVENILTSAIKIAAEGAKEIVLSGVNVGDFGNAKTGETFFRLIERLDEIPANIRFRISSIEPNLLSNDIIEFIARSEKFVPHFHIPLQSGSDKILGLMRRRYKRELYARTVQKIKSLMPDACIGADVMAGFPGESENDFADTYDFINALPISYLHVFTYSERENTDALEIKPIVPIRERRKRNKILRELSVQKQKMFYMGNADSKKNVLFEGKNKDGWMFGFTENYIRVKSEFNSEQINQFVKVVLKKISADENMTAETGSPVFLIHHSSFITCDVS